MLSIVSTNKSYTKVKDNRACVMEVTRYSYD